MQVFNMVNNINCKINDVAEIEPTAALLDYSKRRVSIIIPITIM